MLKKNISMLIGIILLVTPIVLASAFDFVKTIRFNPETSFTLLDFEGLDFDLSEFEQTKSISSVYLRSNDGVYKLSFSTENKDDSNPKTIITAKNEKNEEVECSQFDEEAIICSGGKLFLKVRGAGYSWSGEADSYTFEFNGGELGFSGGSVTGYLNGVEVVEIEFTENSYRFSYYSFPEKARARFHLSGGEAEWINEPIEKSIDTTDLEWDFNNFTQIKNNGVGSIRKANGFTGSVSLNLQGNYDAGSVYTVRNEIYVNLDRLQYTDCPIFETEHILCYIRSGYIHTYIPANKDKTFWKTFPKLFVFEIINDKATLTAGEESEDDLFKISNIDVIDLKFT